MNLIIYIKALLGVDDVNAFWTLREGILRTSGRNPLKVFLCKVVRKHYGAGIPISIKINRFNTPHAFYGIFISQGASIGKNCTIFQQVTIGSNTLSDSAGEGYPVIGDNCWIGAGAKIIGNVHVGNNVRIGANAVVVENIPDDCTVVLNKPRILVRKDKVMMDI